MMYISKEIIEEIFLRLPVKALLRFRCVRKSWNKFLTHNTDFVQTHLKHSSENNNSTVLYTCQGSGVFSINYYQSSPKEISQNPIDHPFRSLYKEIDLSGSCNGVFFIIIGGGRTIGLWNPATKEYKVIPGSDVGWGTDYNVHRYRSFVKTYGFGYDRVSDEYKLVMILSPYSYDEDIMVSKVEVYTMRTNSWRRIEYIPYKIKDELLSKGVFAHEALHWLAKPCPIRSNNKFSQVLLSFNMAKEALSELPLLETFNDNDRFEYKCIDVLEGLLCMLCSHSKVGFEVWVMNDYGVKDSWTKRYNISQMKFDNVIPSFGYLRRIHSLKNGEILFDIQSQSEFSRDTALVFYDPKDETARVEEIDLGKYGRTKKVSTGRLTSMFQTQKLMWRV